MNALSAVTVGDFSFRWRRRTVLVCLCLLGVILSLCVLLLGTGTMSFAPSEIIASLFGYGEDMVNRIVLRIRLPRLVTAIFVGASLGMAGAIFQSVSRNSLGSPDIIGFTTGAATGAIAQIVLFNAGPIPTAIAALVSGIATAILVYLLSMRGRTTGGYQLVLIGIGVGATLTAVNTVLLTYGALEQAFMAQIWLAGSLNTRTWLHAVPVMVCFLVLLPLAVFGGQRLNLLEMGDDAAQQLGVSVERTRLSMVLLAVGLTAVATASAGPIAFVALAGPQLARRLTRVPEVPLVSGALMGSVLLLGADWVSQNAPLGLRTPIGLTAGLLGGLYLLWVLTRSRKV